MTDRVRTLTVVLDRDYRVDDVQTITAALSMVKGVDAVHPGSPDVTFLALQAAKRELRLKLLKVLDDD